MGSQISKHPGGVFSGSLNGPGVCSEVASGKVVGFFVALGAGDVNDATCDVESGDDKSTVSQSPPKPPSVTS
ncbi:hypothetical protein RRG08_066243 [Elysia crispata]|uniref:Uncharacterized protein n=1 Tax=Elysia crispata TaxID=231223 RepID=A0AAE1BD85_9GAST|nr:hypothetical protein RRG08_066243 [Elysia crispata]